MASEDRNNRPSNLPTSTSSIPPQPPHYITRPQGRGMGQVVNPAWTDWMSKYGPGVPNASNNYNPSNVQHPNQASQYAPPSASELSAIQPHVVGQRADANGVVWNIDQYGNPVTRYQGSGTPYGPGGPGGSGGMTSYESAQIALDKQRLADAEAQQAAAQKVAESTAVENANSQFRSDQLKDYYGTLGGMAYASPRGAPVFQKLPEPSLLKQAYADSGQQDPWTQEAPYAGYTGTQTLNAQHPNLSGPFDQPPVPTTGTGSQIPIPTPSATGNVSQAPGMTWNQTPGAPPISRVRPMLGPPVKSMSGGGTIEGDPGTPTLAVLHAGEQVLPASQVQQGQDSSTPIPNQDPTGQSMMDRPGLHPAIAALVDAVSGLLRNPDFKPFVQGTLTSNEATSGGAPSMAMGGIIPDAPGSQTLNRPPGAGGIPGGDPHGMPEYLSPGVTGGDPHGMPVGPRPNHGPTPITPAPQTITPGPGVQNHVPYGPELTGLGGLGAGMTPNGTPVPLSGWQMANWDPTAISQYQSYVGLAGANPADMRQMGTPGTNLAPPKNFIPINVLGGPAGG